MLLPGELDTKRKTLHAELGYRLSGNSRLAQSITISSAAIDTDVSPHRLVDSLRYSARDLPHIATTLLECKPQTWRLRVHFMHDRLKVGGTTKGRTPELIHQHSRMQDLSPDFRNPVFRSPLTSSFQFKGLCMLLESFENPKSIS